jgi:hypothetical protein
MLSKFATGAPRPDPRKYAPLPEFLEYVWLGDIEKVRMVLDDDHARKAFLNEVHDATGMNALHIAVGRNSLEITKLLVDAGIEINPDKEGRMPSLIAALMRVSDELAEYIYEVEERAP